MRCLSSVVIKALILSLSIASAADGTAVSVKITRGTPVESLASDGSVTGVSQATIGTQFSLVNVSGTQIILQDAQGGRYRIALSSTDYTPPLTTTAPAMPASSASSASPASVSVSKPENADSGLSSAPAAVQQTIRSNSNGRTINKVAGSVEDGEVTYEVETRSTDGAEWDLTVAKDGTLLSIDLALAQLPPSVQTAINDQKGSGQLQGVAKQFDDGEVTYLAGITPPGGEVQDFTFGEDGTLLSEEVGPNDLSSNIQTALKTQVGPDNLKSIEKNFDEGQTSYDFTVTDRGGQERSFTLSDDGTLVSKEVKLGELSPEVQAAINAQAGRGKLKSIDQTFDDATTAYDVTVVTPTGQKHDFTISDLGVLVSREMALAETPAAVQSTIAQTLGDGKITHIDQIDDTKRKSYEIEAQKDGKPFNFSVSQKGKFLGMDD